jgi:hypothetical protein
MRPRNDGSLVNQHVRVSGSCRMNVSMPAGASGCLSDCSIADVDQSRRRTLRASMAGRGRGPTNGTATTSAFTLRMSHRPNVGRATMRSLPDPRRRRLPCAGFRRPAAEDHLLRVDAMAEGDLVSEGFRFHFRIGAPRAQRRRASRRSFSARAHRYFHSLLSRTSPPGQPRPPSPRRPQPRQWKPASDGTDAAAVAAAPIRRRRFLREIMAVTAPAAGSRRWPGCSDPRWVPCR